MNKFASILMAAMMIPCAAMAESVKTADPDAVLSFNRASHVTEWEGKWTLAGAYIGETFAEDWDVDISGTDDGFISVNPGAISLEISTILDATANDKQLGTMVDVASYIHGHTHDLAGEMTFADFADEETYSIKSAWDEWPNNVIRGENDGDFNYGPAKTHVKGDDETAHWADITGIEIEDMDEIKYIGLNNAGHLLLCYSDDNVAKKDGEIGYAYIFERVAE